MYVKNLVKVLEIILIIIKKLFGHKYHHIMLYLFLRLVGITVNHSIILLNLCYRYIKVTLLQNNLKGPHQIMLEFTMEFIK